MTDALREAAQAVLARWDSPHWKWGEGPTADLMADLRAALAQPDATAYQRGYEEGLNDALRNGLDWARECFGGEAQPDPSLPALPYRFDVVTRACDEAHDRIKSVPVWCESDMRAYAATAVAAERERCAKVCEEHALTASYEARWAAHDCAAAIRRDAMKEKT